MDNRSKRAGRTERDAAIAHLGEAYAKEYLTRDEWQQRCDSAGGAQTMGDLDRLTYDLPTVLELQGRAKVPGRFRKFLSGWHKPGYPALTFSAIGGVVVSLVSAVFIGNLHVLPKSVQFSLVAFFIASGAISFITTIVAGVCWMEDL